MNTKLTMSDIENHLIVQTANVIDEIVLSGYYSTDDKLVLIEDAFLSSNDIVDQSDDFDDSVCLDTVRALRSKYLEDVIYLVI